MNGGGGPQSLFYEEKHMNAYGAENSGKMAARQSGNAKEYTVNRLLEHFLILLKFPYHKNHWKKITITTS